MWRSLFHEFSLRTNVFRENGDLSGRQIIIDKVTDLALYIFGELC